MTMLYLDHKLCTNTDKMHKVHRKMVPAKGWGGKRGAQRLFLCRRCMPLMTRERCMARSCTEVGIIISETREKESWKHEKDTCIADVGIHAGVCRRLRRRRSGCIQWQRIGFRRKRRKRDYDGILTDRCGVRVENREHGIRQAGSEGCRHQPAVLGCTAEAGEPD